MLVQTISFLRSMEDALTCSICLAAFDTSLHRPRVLSSCGHTLCEFCIRSLLVAPNFNGNCPVCRKTGAVSKSIENIPVNYTLLQVIENYQKETKPKEPSSTEADSSSWDSITFGIVSRSISSFFRYTGGDKTSSSNSLSRSQVPASSGGGKTSSNTLSRPQILASAEGVGTSSSNVPHRSQLPTSSRGVGTSSSNVPCRSQLPTSSRGVGTSSSNIPCRWVTSPSARKHSCIDNSVRNLQEELDYDMAVHLTFCKDPLHRHDDLVLNSSSWSYPDDEDVRKALKFSMPKGRSE